MDALTRFCMGQGFCKRLETLAIEETIPYLERALYDEVEGAEPSHAIENFRLAGEMNETGICSGTFYGMVFQDSDVAKWLEAAAYSLFQKPDERLLARVREVIALIGRAQQKDGYLNTYFTVKEPNGRFSNLREAHELYCAGHMIEAAVALWECIGEGELLSIMRRMADLMILHFQGENRDAFPGHPEVELALFCLYRATGERKYLDLALQFVNARGASDFYQKELDKHAVKIWSDAVGDLLYSQAHLPVREQTDAVGHAVRAVYLYSAMADLAGETGDDELLNACKALWESITQRRMYITGGIGSSAKNEAFTVDYDLPNDTAYAETCASIGLIFFARRMLELEADGTYADEMERALYNGVVAGVQLDGKAFFYVNPLEAIPGIAGKTVNHSHVRIERAKWFACACCPPNAARLFTSLGRYAWGIVDNTLYSHLYIAGRLDVSKSHGAIIELQTDYPVSGTLRYQILKAEAGRSVRLAIRIPAWSQHNRLLINSEPAYYVLKDGYAYLDSLRSGDVVTVEVDMRPRFVYPSARIAADSGMVAVMRGPLVYCAEGVDNGGDVLGLSVRANAALEVLARETIGGVPKLRAAGSRTLDGNQLYFAQLPQTADCDITLIPYFAWANRGISAMRCFLPVVE
ncbi:MAG TPA: glycoside hydrolase family 127 protein [Candidatus Limiplasma sp.]|nr:glycoside hydrolase family 127 protein [Candidatus Limiplasma sp.]